MSDRGKVLSSRILREVGDIQVVVKRAAVTHKLFPPMFRAVFGS